VDVLGGGIEIMVAIVLCAIGFAAGAVKYGDKFWRVLLGNGGCGNEGQ